MSDFIAHVIADLDTSIAKQKMDSFVSQKRTVSVDVELVTKNGNINNFLNQIKSQFGQAGFSAGNNFAKSVNGSINKIDVGNSVRQISRLKSVLQSMNFDSNSINTITKDLKSMEVAVSKVTTKMNGKNLDIKIDGVDQLGRAVSVVKEFDSVTNKIHLISKTISTSFKKAFTTNDVSTLATTLTTLDSNFLKLYGTTNNYSSKIAKLKDNLKGIGKINGLNQQQAEFERIRGEIEKLQLAYKRAQSEDTKLVSQYQLSSKKTILNNQIETWMNKNTIAAKKYRIALDQIKGSLSKVSSAGELKNVERQFTQLKTTAAAAGDLGKGVFATFKRNITNLSPLFGMGALVHTTIRGLKSMYQNVVNIDTAMTELKKVTNEVDSTYATFLSNASKRSVELGTTITNYINSTASFARLGYSMSEAQELSEVANIYTVVGDEISNIDQASSSVISTLKAFGIQADSAMSIVDKFNEVGNNFAISSGGIGDALTRSASSMAAANNTLDETIALITAANTIVQDTAKVGTAFKTISMRIRGAKTELEEAGLETDGMVESTAKLREEILALSGVDIMLDKNTFKSTYKIMEELSGKWKDLTDIQQASITELVAGKRQGNVMSSLMNNFDIAQNALNVSLGSDGSALKEHEKWMESIEAKTNQLKAAWESLSSSFMSSNLIKGTVSGLTGFVSVLDSLIDKFGVLSVAITTIGISKGIKSVSSAIKALRLKYLFSQLTFGTKSLAVFTEAFPKLSSAITAFAAASSAAGGGLSGLGKGVMAFAKSLNPVVLGIVGTIAAIGTIAAVVDATTESFKEANEKADKSRSIYKETAGEVESLKSQLSEVQSRISELNNMDSLSVVEESELKRLQLENEHLERQLIIKQKLANYQGKQAANDANNVLTKEQTWGTGEYLKDENGNVQTVSYSGASIQKYAKGDIIDETIAKQEKLNQRKKEEIRISSELAKLDPGDANYKSKETELNAISSEISNLEKEISGNIDTINNNYLSLFDSEGNVISGFETIANRAKSVLDNYNNADLSLAERNLKSIESYFDGSAGKNFLKDNLLEAAKQAELTADDVHRMGIEIDGVDASEIAKHFNELAKDAERASESIKGVDGSVKGVKAAMESKNQDQSWIDMAEAIEKASELYKNGKIGTDDFQTVAQFMSYDKINPDDNGFKNDADAYVEYWKDATKKVSRYFDKDNPLNSIKNFAKDLVKNDFATKSGNEYTWTEKFKNSAVAAKELGISIEAVETLMHNLESYGFEFDSVMFSAEGFDRYKKSLENIRSIYKEMNGGIFKEHLGELIGNWDEQCTQYENDLSALTEDQIIHIEFVYDLSTIQSEIEELKAKQAGQGGKNAETNAELIAGNQKYINTAKNGLQYENAGVEVAAKLKLSDETINNLYSQLKNSKYGSENYFEIQAKIQNEQELQKALLNAFSEVHPEINADSAIESVESAWADFFSKPQHLYVDAELSQERIERQLEYLGSGSTITFSADIDGDGIKDKINAIKNEDGTISFKANIDGVEKDVQAIKMADGTISYTIGDYPKNVPNAQQQVDRYANNNQISSNPKGVTQKATRYPYNPKGIFSNLKSIYQKVIRTFSGSSDLAGTAHVNGTAYSSGSSGTIDDTSFIKDSWKTTKDEDALTGEVAPEIVVNGNRWWTVGENGAEFSHIPKGSVVFNGKQSEELLSSGKINSRGKSYLGGTAYANGGTLPSGSGSSNSKKSKNRKNRNSRYDDGNDNNSRNDDFKEIIDWIEISFKRISQAIERIRIKAENTFTVFSKRNDAISEEISLITKQISLSKQAYDTYISKANSVGLSEGYASQVRNGTMNVETITDENLAKQIKEYQELYEKAEDAKTSILELNKELSELHKNSFDNLNKEYSDILSVIEHYKDMIDISIQQSEKSGYITSVKYYEALKEHEYQNISQLEKEKSALLSSLNSAVASGSVEKFSTAWYDMCKDINDVTKSIEEAKTAMIEYNNSIREIEWEVFDKTQEQISDIIKESEFLSKLMSNDKLYTDNGQLTDSGKSTMGLHGLNYNVYMAQAEKYKQEMLKINQEIANDPYNQKLIDRKNELLELQQEAILGAEEEKEAIKDMVSDGIELELDALEKLINKFNQAMDAQRDLHDYQKTLDEQTKEIGALEKQLSAYSGDTSEESQAKIQQLKVSLESAKQNLDETNYDKYISDQKMLLDELYIDYETALNERLDNIDALIGDMITEINNNASIISSTITEKAESVGYTITDNMKNIWDTNSANTNNVISSNATNIVNAVTTVSGTLNTINSNMATMISQLNKIAQTKLEAAQQSSATTTPQSSGGSSGSSSPSHSGSSGSSFGSGSSSGGWGSWFIRRKNNYPKNRLQINSSIVDRLKYFDFDSSTSARQKYYYAMGGTGRYIGTDRQNLWMINQMKSHGYKNGVFDLKRNELAWTQEGGKEELFIRPDGGIATLIPKNTSVLKHDATKNLYDFVNNPALFINNIDGFGKGTKGGRNVNNYYNYDIDIPIDRVMDFDDFINQMQHSKRAEKVITSMTTAKLSGGSKIDKFKY